jgi:AcrR family transcriptional regulator
MSTSRADWLVAGQRLLRAGGPDAVRLAALTESLGVTTGSFYHHWTDMDEYLDALADYFGAEQLEEGLALARATHPMERLQRLADLAWDRRMSALDRAMRSWATGNRRAAAAVRTADRALLEFVESAFLDLGFERPDARVRACLLFSAGVANCYVPWPVERKDLDRLLAVVTAKERRPRPKKPVRR